MTIKVKEQTKTINELFDEYNTFFKNFVKTRDYIDAFLVFGSYLKKEITWKSDLDLILVVNNKFKPKIVNEIVNEQSLNIQYYLEYENKLVLYLNPWDYQWAKEIKKIDLFLVSDIESHKKYIIGPENTKIVINDMVIVDKSGNTTRKLENIINSYKFDEEEKIKIIKYHINRFIESFENASSNHHKGDEYAYFFEMNIAYYHLITLETVKNEIFEHLYLPKYANRRITYQNKNKLLNKLEPNLNARIGNDLKKKYIEEFLEIVSILKIKYSLIIDISKTKILLENILERDFFFNFRDASIVSPMKMKKGIIYRSSQLARFSNEKEFRELIERTRIKTIIDLRMKKEIKNYSYGNSLKKLGINYINIPVGEKKIGEEIKLNYTSKRDEHAFYEIFFRYFDNEAKEIFESIVTSEKPILIHCHAGRDRTGIIIGLIQMLVGFSEEEVIFDYLNSHIDTKKEALNIMLKSIQEIESISKFIFKSAIEDSNEVKNFLSELICDIS